MKRVFILITLFLFILVGCNEEVDITIDFVSEGETIVAVEVLELEEFYPTKVNHNFEGWFYDEDYTLAYSFEDEITKDTTIYAKWIKHTDLKYFDYKLNTDSTITIFNYKESLENSS